MLFSLGFIFILGILCMYIFKKISIPPLIGMIFIGIILGPFCFGLIDTKLMSISSEIRQMALIIILLRAGLNLDYKKLKLVGICAILMCFLPAVFEIAGVIIFAKLLFDLSLIDSLLLGCVLAAVSPAVIVPKMIIIADEGYGTKKGIPEMILTASSLDDIFVISLFSIVLSIKSSNDILVNQILVSILKIPTSLILGIIIGILGGFILLYVYKHKNIRTSVKTILILSISFIFLWLENVIDNSFIGFSGMLAVMVLGIVVNIKKNDIAKIISIKLEKLWIVGQILLFVLVGALLDFKTVGISSGSILLLIIFALIFRLIGVYLCQIKTNFTIKEKIFCMIAYIPKATVQASIGGIPLAMGLSCGDIILMISVISILITSTLGAILIDLLYKKLLSTQ